MRIKPYFLIVDCKIHTSKNFGKNVDDKGITMNRYTEQDLYEINCVHLTL